ncbi:MAG: hypothetical protein KDA86_25740 [Planctomycetaceae bacterium]|nr:hypothetical protein [Planctomycetaceae bacterium]
MSSKFGNQDLVTKINQSFEQISRRLFARSLNYCADFKLFLCDQMAGESLDAVVHSALGPQARVGGSTFTTKQEVLESLTSALHYDGDYGAHPNLDYVQSANGQHDFDSVVSDVIKLVDQGDLLISFWLKNGHPFYPVYWDFAFLIETSEDSILFIASSSD